MIGSSSVKKVGKVKNEKKSSAPRGVTYGEMINEVLKSQPKTRLGFTRQAVLKHIVEKHKPTGTPSQVNSRLKLALLKLIEMNQVIVVSGNGLTGRFKAISKSSLPKGKKPSTTTQRKIVKKDHSKQKPKKDTKNVVKKTSSVNNYKKTNQKGNTTKPTKDNKKTNSSTKKPLVKQSVKKIAAATSKAPKSKVTKKVSKSTTSLSKSSKPVKKSPAKPLKKSLSSSAKSKSSVQKKTTTSVVGKKSVSTKN